MAADQHDHATPGSGTRTWNRGSPFDGFFAIGLAIGVVAIFMTFSTDRQSVTPKPGSPAPVSQ